jgi:WD40 repeat protein
MNNSLDWSPDGTKIAINCQTLDVYKTWIEIRDAATGKVLQTLSDPDPTFVTTGALWSPDGTRLLSVGGDDQVGSKENPVIIWDAKTGKQLVKITRHTGQIWLPSWSPNGTRVATGSTDDTTRIWNAETGDELLALSTPNNWSATVGWSPDGRYLAVSTFSFDMPGRAEVWRVWQSTEELIAYAKQCCIFRALTPEERAQFGLPLR